MADPVFKRILLKLSGEALMGDLEYGTDPDVVRQIARQIQGLHDRGVEVAVVLGAGNIYRGLMASEGGMDRARAENHHAVADGYLHFVTHAPRPHQMAIKRLFDIVFALCAIVVTVPLYPVVMLAIWLEDGRPFFFGHKRETIGGREFGCLKFRSMFRNAEQVKAEYQKKNAELQEANDDIEHLLVAGTYSPTLSLWPRTRPLLVYPPKR